MTYVLRHNHSKYFLLFYTVLRRYILFCLFSSCGSKSLSRLKFPLSSNVEPIGVAYAPSIVAVEDYISLGIRYILDIIESLKNPLCLKRLQVVCLRAYWR